MIIFILFIITLLPSYGAIIKDAPGCPENSHCSSDMGQMMQKWEQVLQKKSSPARKIKNINRFIKNYGYPTRGWHQAKLRGKNVIAFDSHCPHHQLPEKEIDQALMFTRPREKKPSFVLRPVYVKTKAGFALYHIPRDTLPLALSKKGLIFQEGFMGHYLTLITSSRANIKAISSPDKTPFPQTKPCTQELLAYIKKQQVSSDTSRNIFRHYLCQDLWHQDKKSYQPFITVLDCPK